MLGACRLSYHLPPVCFDKKMICLLNDSNKFNIYKSTKNGNIENLSFRINPLF